VRAKLITKEQLQEAYDRAAIIALDEIILAFREYRRTMETPDEAPGMVRAIAIVDGCKRTFRKKIK